MKKFFKYIWNEWFPSYTVKSIVTQELYICSSFMNRYIKRKRTVVNKKFSAESNKWAALYLCYPFSVSNGNVIHDTSDGRTYVVGDGFYDLKTISQKLEISRNGKLYKVLTYDNNFIPSVRIIPQKKKVVKIKLGK